jgi:hypothetical protein
MKTYIIAAIMIAVFFSCSIRPKLYSREERQQHIADSLRAVDSLRVADSVRVADSLMIARYHTADKVIKKERQHHKDSVFSDMFVFNDDEPVYEPVDDEPDAVSARSIVIAPDNPQAKKIDSLQTAFDRKNALLHDGDTHFRRMKTFAISEKKRYMRFLLQHKMKDTAQIAVYCNSLADLYRTQLAIFSAIQESQKGNTKSFVRRHREQYESRMEELSEFILALTPEVPFRPSHTLHESYSDQ